MPEVREVTTISADGAGCHGARHEIATAKVCRNQAAPPPDVGARGSNDSRLMIRLTSSSGYALGGRLDTTSRVVISDAVRRGAAGFRKHVMIVSLRQEVASRERFSSRDFLEAARTFAALSHESVLPIEDVGVSAENCPFAVAPRFHGRALSQLFVPAPARAKPIAPRVALRVVARIAVAAHLVAGLLEAPLGGLCADAVWVGEGGRVLLLPSAHRRGSQADGERPDVQALGLLLWDLLVLGRSAEARSDATRAEALPFDRAVVQVVMRALASNPRERFEDASALGRELFLLAEALPDALRSPSGVPERPASRRGTSVLSVMPSPTRSAFEPAVVHSKQADDPVTLPLLRPRSDAKPASFAWLRCLRGGAGGELLLVAPAARWVVGRSGAADFVVSDPDVSRQHFEIVREPSGTYRVRDLGSKNGLFVNGAPALACPLSPGDEVRAGDTVLRFDA
jgi:hypothetical protein